MVANKTTGKLAAIDMVAVSFVHNVVVDQGNYLACLSSRVAKPLSGTNIIERYFVRSEMSRPARFIDD